MSLRWRFRDLVDDLNGVPKGGRVRPMIVLPPGTGFRLENMSPRQVRRILRMISFGDHQGHIANTAAGVTCVVSFGGEQQAEDNLRRDARGDWRNGWA